jgi:molybdopterin biosynthesis enzyme
MAARELAGAVLARDVTVDGVRWAKGRRLAAADVAALASMPAAASLTLLLPEVGEVHEDDAALRLARAATGPGLALRSPAESRVDMVATIDGVARISVELLDAVNAIDRLAIFTILDDQPVVAGDLVASAKTGPHLVPEADLVEAEAILTTARSLGGPLAEVRPYRPTRIAAVVKEVLPIAARARFEATLRAKAEALGSVVAEVRYVADDPVAVAAAFRALVGDGAELVLTAGAASTDPSDSVFVAFAAIGGEIRSHGVPAHPGSMLWLGVAAGTTFLGLPTCGAYSKATAADLLLPRLLAGEAPTRALTAGLAHGGILAREMRFRFPPYARSLEAPEG